MRRLKFMVTKLLFAAFWLIAAYTAGATDDPQISTIFKGHLGEIVADPTGALAKETIDNVYYDPNLFSTIANPNNDKITNAISLLINEAWIYKIKTDFTAKVEIKIDYTLLDGTTGSIASQWLEINYTIAGGLKYNTRQTIKFDRCRKVKVTILSVNTPITYSWNVWEVLDLENRMLRKRDYIFDNNTFNTKIPPTHTTPAAGADEVLINWSSDPLLANGKTHIDIEWTWVDAEALENYKKPDPNDNNNLKLDAGLLFKNNSSRLTIAANINTYAIPLIYDGAGHLFYRIRPVQYKEDEQVVNGSWSADLFTGITYYTRAEGEGHQENLNWQTTTSFAEEGKRKTVVQYFDGTLRGRQTVTKDNVSNKTVVAESFYDYQGRPTINILPAPTMNTVIKFTEDFNKFAATYVTPKDAFDLMPINTNACSFLTPQLDKNHTTGAAQYYSDQNPEKTQGINQFIPDANGYAYVETRYTPDATGRIEAQGGVGETFQLGKGNNINDHDTKYFYGKPDQKELDALFGTEAGDATHYSKNMVRDANGQYSVSYVDMHGRTVATALAGTVPASLKALDSYAAGNQTLTKDLLSTKNNRVEGRDIVSSTSLIVTKDGPHDFHYELSPRSAEIIACIPPGQTFCYDCYYDLEIRITGGCSTQIVKSYTNLSFTNEGIPIVDQSCGTLPPAININFTETLFAGEYNISKKLTVNKAAQDWYRDNVFNVHNICKKLEDFYKDNYSIFIAQSPCEITCTQCTTALGTFAQYRAAFLTQQGINPNTTVVYESEIVKSYNDAKKNCDDICTTDRKNTLGAIRDAMLDDMTPGYGQYARMNFDLNEDGITNPGHTEADYNTGHGMYETNTTLPFNIFNLSLNPPRYKDPLNENGNANYLDELGNLDLSKAAVAQVLFPEDFSEIFKPSWANALIKYHPEYCKLLKAETSLKESYTRDAQMEEVNTWQAADVAGYIFPNDGTGIVDNDPFFTGVGQGYKTTMIQYIKTNFNRLQVAGPPGQINTLWKLAYMSVFCLNNPSFTCAQNAPIKPSLFNNPNGSCTADWNYVWRFYRTLYLSEKERFVNMWLDEQCNSSIDYPLLTAKKYERRFGKPEDYYTSGNYLKTVEEKVKNESSPNVETEMAAQYDDNCESYKTVWKRHLLQCDKIAAYTVFDAEGNYLSNVVVDDMMTGLKAVCIAGSDRNHPMGSSTVKPGTPINVPQSFQEVFNNVWTTYFNTDPKTAICHENMIDFPMPYDKQAPLSDYPVVLKKDACLCNRLAELTAEKNTDPTFPGGNLSQYILYRHGITVRQTLIDSLTSGCNEVPGCTFWDPSFEVPAIFNCNTPIKNCIGCVEYNTLKTQFKNANPSWAAGVIYANPQNDDELNANKAFAKFMNNKTGFIKTWIEYLEFENTCNIQTRPAGINSATIPGCIPTFQKLYGGTGAEVASNSVLNIDGSSVIAGYTNSFGNGGYDGHIKKIGKSGNIIWSEAIGGTGDDYFTSIKKVGSGGYICVGYTKSAPNQTGGDDNVSLAITMPYLVKIDDNGVLQWSKKLVDNNTYGSVAWDVTSTSDGGYAIAGSYKHSPGVSNAYIIKTDQSGTVQWAKSFDHGNTDQGLGIIEDGNTLVVTAHHYTSPSFSGDVTSLGTEAADTTVNDPQVQNGPLINIVLMKLNKTDGSIVWAHDFDIDPLVRSDWPTMLKKTNDSYSFSVYKDDVVTSGVVHPQYLIAKTDLNGNPDYIKRVAGSDPYLLGLHSPTTDGGMIIAQWEPLSSTGDIHLVKLNATGAVEWAKLFGSTGVQTVQQVWQTADLGYIVTGFSPGGAGNTDEYIIQTDNLGRTINCPDNNTTATITTPAYTINTSFVWNSVTNISVTALSVGSAVNTTLVITTICGEDCNVHEGGPLLCGLGNMFPAIGVVDTCNAYIPTLALNKATEQYQAYLEEQKDLFENIYLTKCLEAKDHEIFTVTSAVSEYHYTLYYYDQAGNLVKTVPPVGVQPNFTATFFANVKTARTNGADLTINHNLLTQYRYNALNQVTAQISPDGGISHFWYDIMGRLVVSQNAKQQVQNKYSYTIYDELGRITEVGEKNKQAGHSPMTQVIAQHVGNLQNWLTASSSEPNKDITKTVYDVKYDPVCTQNLLCQQNLRNRVSYTYVQALENGNSNVPPWETASFYTYDIHGNVDVLLQDYNTGMGAIGGGNRFKKITYKYDLISGKVNEVAYQPGFADAFYHKYQYDAENKLTETWTSKEYVYWEREARYKYYRHGPLARTVLGELEVQGVDYAYTLQGWLKGVNSTAQQNGGTIGNGEDCGSNSAVDNLNVFTRQSPFSPTYVARNSINFLPSAFASNMPDNFETVIDPTLGSCGNEGTAGDEINSPFNNGLFDMGQDGKTDINGNPVITTYPDAYGNNTRTTDVYGYSLNYFNGDYNRISQAAANPFAVLNMAIPTGDAGTPNTAPQLFNGNIGAMLVSIPKLGSAKVYGYNYDQLNRITNMFAFKGINTAANTFTPVAINDYKEKITYDANGNILTYKRNGVNGVVPGGPGGLDMDDMTYEYIPNSNKLKRVTDNPANSGNYPDDIDNQTDAQNYVYDEIGNLIIDKAEKLYDPANPTKAMIEWNVYGKISRITKKGDPFDEVIEYKYDASGNRIQKIIYPPDKGISKITYYVRDASGNVMSVYESGDGAVNNGELSQREIHLYGSSRLGVYNVKVNVQTESRSFISMNGVSGNNAELFTFTRANKFFELSNHLGNVLVTVTDKKIGVFTGTGNSILSYYKADIATANDYYPFGMAMPGRKFSAGTEYRYGFNGKENDKSINNGTLDFGARIYDARLGKWLSTDLITKHFISPYNYSSNNPVNYLDPDGEDNIHFFYVIQRTYADGKLLSAKSTKFTVVEKNNEPNVFVHHKVELRSNNYLGEDAKVVKQIDTRFYPEVPREKSGLTTSYGFLKIKDDDRKTLIKFIDEYSLSRQEVDAQGGAGGYTEIQGSGSQASDRMVKSQWWGDVFADKNAFDKQQRKDQIETDVAVTLLSIVAPELILARLARGAQIFYRTMSKADAAIFQATGRIPAGTETMISPTLAYAKSFDGVTFQITTKAGTLQSLLKIGVSDGSQLLKSLKLARVQKGWKANNAFFKTESNAAKGLSPQINIGLGDGKALQIFNNNITTFRRI